ncbi:Cellulase [Purpureocillium takamizusanense]|uniref:Endoglucanase EG-II n=3 Tax=Purpureocillium takamizusanense TaxID=2060973 RepID=A0A9Q8V9L0_9HYPO|nr:Cellulase [Purpureocillium takamizusanense]UNI16806.1 Cellulase [Purpureocillium takamizusanense]
MHTTLRLLALLGLASRAIAGIQYLGVAIPGIDFGCDINGKCPAKAESIPLAQYGGGDGEGQMQHFVKNNKMNIFRLPLTWQFITNGQVDGKLYEKNLKVYNDLMNTCLDTGAYCMIDLHNFGRYDDGIIGQGGPSDQVFAGLWSQFATEYAKNDKVVFGLMNEPHDLDIKLWAKSCQAAVTAIRKAGAKKHLILLPGTNFASAETFVSTGSAEALAAIENPDGSTDGLLLDLHKYLDINNSGTHTECTTDNVEGFKTIATWLRKNKRQAMVSETGASMDPTCMEKFCAQNDFIADNTDVFIGFVGWGAGSFDGNYIMTLTPLGKAGSYTDNKLMSQCIMKKFGTDRAVDAPSSSSSFSAPTSTSADAATSTSQPIFRESSAAPSPSPTAAPNNKKDNGSGNLRASGSAVGLLLAMAVATLL